MTVVLGSSQEHPVFIRAFSSLWLPGATPEQMQWFIFGTRIPFERKPGEICQGGRQH